MKKRSQFLALLLAGVVLCGGGFAMGRMSNPKVKPENLKQAMREVLLEEAGVEVSQLTPEQIKQKLAELGQKANKVLTAEEQSRADLDKLAKANGDKIPDYVGSSDLVVTSITDDGYTVSHGDHEHYMFGIPKTKMRFAADLILPVDARWNKDQVVGERAFFYVVKMGNEYKIAFKHPALYEQLYKRLAVGSNTSLLKNKVQKNGVTPVYAAETGDLVTDDGYVFNPKDIVKETNDGYVVRHGDHYHYIPKSQVHRSNSNNKVVSVVPTKKPHVHQHQHDNSSLTEDDYQFDPKDIVEVTDDGYIVRHGDHYHYIFKKDLPEKYRNLKIPGGSTTPTKPTKPSKPSNPTKPTEPTKPVTPTKPAEPVKPDKPNNGLTSQGLKEGSEKLSSEDLEKVKYFAELNNLKLSELMVKGGVIIWPHQDHYHATPLSDIEVPKTPSKPDSEMTDDELEAEFEAELHALAKAMNVPVNSIEIKDGNMIVPHGDHSHTYPIRSKGWKLYLQNKIAPIVDDYIAGPYNAAEVMAAIEQLKDDARYYLHDNKRQYQRVVEVLDRFAEEASWGTNSTKGYLAALEKFKDKYLTKGGTVTLDKTVTPIPKEEADKASQYDKVEEKINEILELYDVEHDIEVLSTSSKLRQELRELKEKNADVSELEKRVDAELAKLKERYAEHVNTNEALNKRLEALEKRINQLDRNKYTLFYIKVSNKLNDLQTKPDEQGITDLENEVEQFIKEHADALTGSNSDKEPGTQPVSPNPEPGTEPGKPAPEESEEANEDALAKKTEEARKAYWMIDQKKAPFMVYYQFNRRIDDATTVEELEQVIKDIEQYLVEHPEHRDEGSN